MSYIEKFLQIEKDNNLYNESYDGVNYWNYIRFTLFNYGIMEKFLTLNPKLSENRNIAVKEFFKLAYAYIKYLFSIHKKQSYDVLFSILPRRINIDGKNCSIYTDFIEPYFPNSISLELPKVYIQPFNIYTCNLKYLFNGLPLFFAKTVIGQLICSKTYRKKQEEIKQRLAKPFKEIEQAFNINLDLNYWARYSLLRIEKVHYYRKIVGELIEKYSPKVIVQVVYYETQNMVINEIAKSKKIPTIELQHGTMHSDHSAYQFLCDETLPQLPDYIFTFSDYWSSVAHLPIHGTKLITTGFPFFEKNLEQYRSKKKNERITIVFISQETIGRQLSELAVELNELLPVQKYKIIYKLHPGEYIGWKTAYKRLANSTIDVIDSSEKSIYSIFSASDIQVGAYSTAIFEGLGFGLKTFIYKVGHADTMESLVKQGFACFVNDVNELLDKLQKWDSKNNGISFWKTNALQNICKQIEMIGNIEEE